uniref:Uncharacterized protein n=1 Tax=viral metagenome TaxID=1070528 RepID=A0A6H2A326_9ZZZZ
MEYIIWKKEAYADTWTRYNCEDELQLKEAVLELIKSEGDIEVTVPRAYKIDVKVLDKSDKVMEEVPKVAKMIEKARKLGGKDAAPQSEAEPDQSTGG